MALINCPECGNQVSTTADVCPHCGYNIKRILSYCPMCTDNNEEILMDYIKDADRLKCPKCGWECGFMTPIEENERKMRTELEELQKANQVHCPFCHSTNVHKISGTERVVSVVGLGIFSKKINKSFKCNNCDGTF